MFFMGEVLDRRGMLGKVGLGLGKVGLGLVGLVSSGFILPADEVYAAGVESSFDVDETYSNGGLDVSYNNRPGRSEVFNVRLSKGKKTSLSSSDPGVGLGGAYDNYLVRAHPREGEMELVFNRGGKHGGFDIRNSVDNVYITLWSGQLCVEKPSGWTLSRLTMEGDGVIRSGSNRLIVQGKSIRTDNPLRSGYKGSTPMYIIMLGADTGFEFLRDGNMRAHKRADFPLPGEKLRR